MPPDPKRYDTHRREASAKLRAELTAWICANNHTICSAAAILGVCRVSLSRWLDGPSRKGRPKALPPMNMSAGTRYMLRRRLNQLKEESVTCHTPPEPASQPPGVEV